MRERNGNDLRVIIIGSGITGMFAAYYLRKGGHEVTILDSASQGVTSVNNAGFITPSFILSPHIGLLTLLSTTVAPRGPIRISMGQIVRNPRWFATALRARSQPEEQSLKFGRLSLRLFGEVVNKEGFDVDLVQGVVGLFLRPETAAEFAARINGRYISGNELGELGYCGFGGGMMIEDQLSVNPVKLFNQMRHNLVEKGVRFEYGGDATLLGKDGMVNSVSFRGNRLIADCYLVAAGAASTSVCQSVGYNPHVLPARGLAMLLNTGGTKIVDYPALLEDYGITVAQHNFNTLRIAGLFEFAGFKESFDESRRRWLIDTAARHMHRAANLRHESGGVGFRPCTPDQMPVTGSIPGYRNLYIATGNCRLGLTLAAATGNLLASVIGGEPSPDDIPRQFSPARFDGGQWIANHF